MEKKKIVVPSATDYNLSDPENYTPSFLKFDDKAMEFIVYITFSTCIVLMLLPYSYVDGNPVPVIIFNDLRPFAFHAFVLFIIFAFSGAFNAILAKNKPRLVRFCRCYSMVSMVLAMTVLGYATILSSLRWASGQFQIGSVMRS